jgi:hypothetical protein
LINSNYLQVGGLLVSNTWVFGDVIEPIMNLSNGVPLLTVYCRPQKTYVVQASRNLSDWFTITTATPTNSRFDYLVTNLPAYDHLFFRPVMMDQFFNQLNLSLTNRNARLDFTGGVSNNTIVIQASTDLKNWTPISTYNIATGNFFILDTNAPNFNTRFYRVIGQGK